MRFYFHIRSEQKTIPDREGTDLADIADARREGLECVRELESEFPRSSAAVALKSVDVADETGAVLFSLPVDA
jgi:hypothetical protein